MSDKSLSIRVKIGNNEIELSGPAEEVSKALDDLPKIVSVVSNSFSTIKTDTTVASQSPESTMQNVEEFPTISAPIGISCPEAVISILSTSWGREKPRNLGEITEAMKVNALHFPTGTIKGRLTDLTKKGILRRIRGEKGYGYVVVK